FSNPLINPKGLCLRVVGVGDSKSLVVSDDLLHKGLDDSFLLELCRVKSSGESLSKLRDFGECRAFVHPESNGKILEIASQLGRKTGLVFVDCSASSDTVAVLKQAIDMGCCAVLANKKPLTSTMSRKGYYDVICHRIRPCADSQVRGSVSLDKEALGFSSEERVVRGRQEQSNNEESLGMWRRIFVGIDRVGHHLGRCSKSSGY
ncbi:unnamed protein product, partial [Sphenostylis stenocarpa]